MQLGVFYKEYLALLEGVLKDKKGTIDAPIARKQGSIIERCIDLNGAKSVTHYEVLDTKNDLSIVKFVLETGRTHQIRLHSKYIGNPILGDSLYGKKSNLISRQALHAYKISFIHPISKEKMNIEIELPEDMKKLI